MMNTLEHTPTQQPAPEKSGKGNINTSRPWPGTNQWNDKDYQLFVDLYNQGRFPGIHDDPTAWDEHFKLADTPGNTHRPTLISVSDFNNHLPPTHRATHGLLVLKLWEIARSKGCTRIIEQQQEINVLERQRVRTKAEKKRLRRRIKSMKGKLPDPPINLPVDPRIQWYAKIMASALPNANLNDKVKHVQQAVIEGQPYRNSALQKTDPPAQPFGPLMLPESADALEEPFEPLDSDPLLKKWEPDATTDQIINGAARELADLVSLLIARQRIAVGYAADKDTISQTRYLTRSLRELAQLIHQTEVTTQTRKRGRPKKETFINPELLPN